MGKKHQLSGVGRFPDALLTASVDISSSRLTWSPSKECWEMQVFKAGCTINPTETWVVFKRKGEKCILSRQIAVSAMGSINILFGGMEIISRRNIYTR